MNVSYFFLGAVKISVDYDNITALLNLCMYHGIVYSDFCAYSDRVTMVFRTSAFQKMKRKAEKREICFEVIKRSGLPFFLSRYKYRFGLILGIICAAALIFISQRIVWEIEVTGNREMTSREVFEVLSRYGFSVGSYIPSVNTDRIENKILIESDDISWISINIIGTVAEVQIRERTKPPAESTKKKPANLVAAKSGLIEDVRIFRGNTLVASGQYVEKGQLLVSGLFDSTQVGFRYTRASGAVYAKTVEEFYIEIPYEYEGKVYTGDEYYNKYLNFFSYSMNISKNCGNEGVFYDKIDIVERCDLFSVIKTPFSVRTEKFLEYETVKMTRTKEAAEDLAYFELESRLSSLAEDTVILKKTIIPYLRDDRFILHCVITLIEDIASVSEFEVELG